MMVMEMMIIERKLTMLQNSQFNMLDGGNNFSFFLFLEPTKPAAATTPSTTAAATSTTTSTTATASTAAAAASAAAASAAAAAAAREESAASAKSELHTGPATAATATTGWRVSRIHSSCRPTSSSIS